MCTFLILGCSMFFNKRRILSNQSLGPDEAWSRESLRCVNVESSLVALSELHHGIFFPAKHVFNIKYI